MERTITIHCYNEEEYGVIRQQTGSELFEAIGYLANWNSAEKFPYVHIRCTKGTADNDIELIASYWPYKTAEEAASYTGRAGYVIGAIWRPDQRKFSFHS